jgi:hypothetical protein
MGGSRSFAKASWPGSRGGARLWLPIFLTLQAEAYAVAGRRDAALQAIEQALVVSEETGERWADAEVLRVKTRLLLATDRTAADEIEALLVHSLKVARNQQALLRVPGCLRFGAPLARRKSERASSAPIAVDLWSIQPGFCPLRSRLRPDRAGMRQSDAVSSRPARGREPRSPARQAAPHAPIPPRRQLPI